MPQASKTFRIFVSSTFSDMKAERNALQEHVFPRLRELCMQHGTRFQAIDLRWGVSEEASLDQQTMKICLEEIARCQRVTPRPNFIVLLGDRYGWQPLPEEIPAAEFEAILERVSPEERALLCWEEQDAAGRRGWYRRDDNAVPAVYVLQPREGEFEDYATWHTKVERPLLQVLRQAVAGLDLPPEARLRYEASAAHQEIERGAMQVEDADEHVFGFFRRITNLDEVKDDLPGAAAKDYVDADADGHFDADAYRRLQDLKGQLGGQIGHNIHEYDAQWTGEGITGDHTGRLPEEMAACQAMLAEDYVPQNLCQAVWRALALVILAECEQMEEKGALELEVEAHAEFGQERARFFVGREAILEEIATYLAGGSQHPLAVWGASGTGKSALMAKAIEDAEKKHGQAEVIYRFIGATPDSSNGRALLESLCRQVSEAYGADASDLPLEYRDLVSEFTKRLALASSNKPLILFLDALDQFSDADNARNLTWLPRQLPEHVKLVVSTLPGECLDALEAKLPRAQRLELEAMSSQEGADLLDRWLASVGRTVQPGQRSEVLDEFSRCGLPLYLKLAFEEARRWCSYDGVPDLGSDIPGIIGNLFQRLSDEPNHGEMLVSRSLGYLAVAKNGLTEDELLDVLSADGDVMADFHRRSPQSPDVNRLPVVVWSRLYHDLEPYLTERAADETSLMSFYHRQLREMVQHEFLDRAEQGNRHRGLAQHFGRQPLWVEREDERMPNIRKVSELPHHLVGGEQWADVFALLSDFGFIQAKCEAGMLNGLLLEYNLTLAVLPAEYDMRALELIQGALRLSAHVIGPGPDQVASQLTGRLLASENATIQGLLEQIREEQTGPWLHPLTASLTPSGGPLLRTLAGHTGGVTAVAVIRDGRRAISASRDCTLKVWDLERGEELRTLTAHRAWVTGVAVTSDGRRAISASRDCTLKVWDLERGEELHTLIGHRAWVTGVAVTMDGRRAISASRDHTLKVWDLGRGKELYTLTGHTGEVREVAVTMDGRRAISASQDGTLKVWDLERGKELRTLTADTFGVTGMAVTPDGRWAISALYNGTLKVWDLDRGEELRSLWGHPLSVGAVAVTMDGRRAISAAIDKTLIVWDLERGEKLRTLEGHSQSINAVAVTMDGRRAISASEDRTLKVWDLECGEELCTLTVMSHSAGVNSVAVTMDGRRAISASQDGTLKVWDLERGKELRTLTAHTFGVTGMAVTPDGRRAISASTDETLIVWDLERGEKVRTLAGHTDSVWGVVATPDGRRAISASEDMTLKVWDLECGEELCTLMGLAHYAGVNAVAVTADGRWVISASSDETLILWDLERGEKLRTLEGHSQSINAVAVTPDGRQAISASDDRTLKVWDLEHGEELYTLTEHTDGVRAVAVTSEGRRAISASKDRTLKVWDLQSGNAIATFSGEGELNACAVAPDGMTIVAGERSGRVHFLRLEGAG